jgi:hypothetical protein
MPIPVLPDDELDRLYGLPLEEFTRGRDELARELRKAGEQETAAEVKALAKPSLSAWTVNQLARREPMQVRALMTAGERLRDAQTELLRGGDPAELQGALRRQRDVIEALLESAKRILQSGGRPASEAMLERMRGTLTAAAADEDGASLVERGRLVQDLEHSGFGGPAIAPKRPHKRPARQQKGKDEEARKQRIEDAKQKVDELRAAVAEQKDRLRRATSEARKAQAEVDRLTARLDEAKEALGRARST